MLKLYIPDVYASLGFVLEYVFMFVVRLRHQKNTWLGFGKDHVLANLALWLRWKIVPMSH